jgi:hypothetical protein
LILGESSPWEGFLMDEACAVDVCVDLNALAMSPAHSFTAAIISVMIEQGPSSWYHCLLVIESFSHDFGRCEIICF